MLFLSCDYKRAVTLSISLPQFIHDDILKPFFLPLVSVLFQRYKRAVEKSQLSCVARDQKQ